MKLFSRGKFTVQGDAFGKDVLRVGRWEHPLTGQEIVMTPARLENLARNTRAFAENGNRIPYPKGHNTDPEKNRGFWDGNLVLDGGTMYGVVKVPNPETAAAMERGEIDGVSVNIEFNHKDPKGKVYDEVITHICATNYPVVTEQGGFMKLSQEAEQELGKDVFVEALAGNPNHDEKGRFGSGSGGGTPAHDPATGSTRMTVAELNAAMDARDAGQTLTPRQEEILKMHEALQPSNDKYKTARDNIAKAAEARYNAANQFDKAELNHASHALVRVNRAIPFATPGSKEHAQLLKNQAYHQANVDRLTKKMGLDAVDESTLAESLLMNLEVPVKKEVDIDKFLQVFANVALEAGVNKDGTFKGGFDGCVKVQIAKGHPKEHAEKICGYINANKG